MSLIGPEQEIFMWSRVSRCARVLPDWHLVHQIHPRGRNAYTDFQKGIWKRRCSSGLPWNNRLWFLWHSHSQDLAAKGARRAIDIAIILAPYEGSTPTASQWPSLKTKGTMKLYLEQERLHLRHMWFKWPLIVAATGALGAGRRSITAKRMRSATR